MRVHSAAVVAIAMVPVLAAAQQLLPDVRPPVDPNTRFEVASIKPFDPSAALRMSVSPGRYDVAGVPSQVLLSQALGVPFGRIIGVPDWIFKERYAIAAKAPEGTPSTDGRVMFVMLRNLLKDRFQMATHTDTREMPVFNLVFARNDKRFGPALKESSAECRATFAARDEEARRGARAAGVTAFSECESLRFTPGSGTASFSGVRMAAIAQILSQPVGRPVVDKTGLTSYYNVTLKWTPDVGSAALGVPGLPAGAPPPPPDPDAPNLFTALQEQLGLKLESALGPVDVVVIDKIEKPTLD